MQRGLATDVFGGGIMEIRFISSLTPDDEARCAASLVSGLRQVLAPFPIAYDVRVQTSDGRIFHDDRLAREPSQPPSGPFVERRSGRDRRTAPVAKHIFEVT